MRVCIRKTKIRTIPEGTALALIPNFAPPGRMETPENGFVWVEIKNSSPEELEYLFEKKLIDGEEQNTTPVRVVNLDTPLQTNLATAKHSQSHNIRAGRTIKKHLEGGKIIPVTKAGLLTKEE